MLCGTMMRPEELPDRVHIEALREALWRPVSRAAVMVGAGMSRNADKLSPAVPDFPLWWQIGKELRKAVGPRAEGYDALRLGQMYENTYGRARLDDLFLEIIPDAKYEPGLLHERLLRLPWADVFTTNYDTLLERTRVPERRYETVEIPADLTRAERPRIVKLHGSFPARRPFIFTAEDYRRYPTDFAPFINLVRQSAMESVLCLVGFSGEDPNFLQWAGWVRDQLGPTAPRMYLCGALDLTTPERSYYQHMQVIPVDLGPLFPKEEWAGADRHRPALAWLLESLHAGEPVDRGNWPRLKPPARTVPLPASSSPPLSPPRAPELLEEPGPPKTELDASTLQKLLASWKSEHATYPGWALCPEHVRRWLAYNTQSWLWHLVQPAGLRLLEELPLAARADALGEIAWRVELCLLPLPDSLLPLIEKVLESFNPRPRLINLRDAALTPATASERLSWDHLAEVWVDLAFAVLRHAWQAQEPALHERWAERLKGIAETQPRWRARWWYAQCWHHFVRLETKQAVQTARDWPAEPSLPFWEAKRAAMLGEMGQVDTARKISAQALERVRLGRDPTQVDYRSLSDEAWIYLLQGVLEGDAWDVSWAEHEQREHRLRDLARHHCNPWDDLRDRAHAVVEDQPGGRRARTRSFDPGWAQWKTTSKPGLPSASAWALICTWHDGPKRLHASDGLLAALRRLWRYSPRLVLGLAVRAGASDALSEGEALAGLVGRAAVASLPKAEVDGLYDWLAAVLPAALAEQQEHQDSERDDDPRRDRRRIQGAAEILSRIAFRLDQARLTSLFELACSMYLSPACQHELALHEPVARLLHRTLYAASPAQLGAWLPRLLSLPVAGEPGFDVAYEAIWPDPFQQLSRHDFPPLTPADITASSAVIGRLLGLVREGTEARSRASSRLAVLALLGALTPNQLQSFLGAVWNDTNTQGYPADIGFVPWVLLKLPERQPGEARRVIFRYFRDAELDPVTWLRELDSTTAPLAEPLEGPAHPGLTWTPEEARDLLAKLTSLWQKRDRLHRELPERICFALSTAIVPFLDPGDAQVRAQVHALIVDMRQGGARTTCAWPALLLLGGSEEAAAQAVHGALLGARTEEVDEGASTLLVWIDLGYTGQIAPPPAWLVDTLVNAGGAGRSPGLVQILDGLGALLQRKNSALEDRHLQVLARALDRLRATMAIEGMRDDGTWDDDLPLDGGERMAVLAKASALSAAMAAVYRHRGAQEPAAVAAWRALAPSHPLPEVRRPWRRETGAASMAVTSVNSAAPSSGVSTPPSPSEPGTP